MQADLNLTWSQTLKTAGWLSRTQVKICLRNWQSGKIEPKIYKVQINKNFERKIVNIFLPIT